MFYVMFSGRVFGECPTKEKAIKLAKDVSSVFLERKVGVYTKNNTTNCYNKCNGTPMYVNGEEI